MAQARTVIGLDVHATKIVAATLDTDSARRRWWSPTRSMSPATAR